MHNSLPFPASQIQAIEWPEGEPPRVVVNFMGLTGPVGALPQVYTELVIERIRARDRSLEAFFDIFNHRFLSLFYRAWEKYRFLVGYERDRSGAFSRYLASLIVVSAHRACGTASRFKTSLCCSMRACWGCSRVRLWRCAPFSPTTSMCRWK